MNMIESRRGGLLLAFVICLPFLACAASPSQGAASSSQGAALIVTDVKGSVTLTEDGKSRPALLLTYLRPGSSLRLAPNAVVVLTHTAKPLEETLTGPAEAAVTAEGIRVAKGAKAAARALDGNRVEAANKFQAVQRDKVGMASVVMRSIQPRITLEGPSNTRISTVKPVLRWRSTPGMPGFRVKVSEKGGAVHFEESINGTAADLSKAPLKYGSAYEWQVEASPSSGGSAAAKGEFIVLDAAGAQRIASLRPASSAPFSERLLFAAQLEAEGLSYEAASEWRALSQERPDDDNLRRWARR